tara:strand:+ start:192 stop:410 length:219 start_codon:yes stop_codon:yes gene_type:complete
MHKLVIEIYSIVKELIGATADVQIRLEELEEYSHPPIDWEEIIHSNIERIESLERKLLEEDSEQLDSKNRRL